MTDSVTQQQIIKKLNRLPPELQKKVLAFAQQLDASQPKGTPGKQLLRFAGIMEPDDIKAMKTAIEQGCEQVDPDGW